MVSQDSGTVAARNILTRLGKRSGLSSDRLRTTEIDVAPLLDLPAVRRHAHRAGTAREEAVLPVIRDLARQLNPSSLLIVDAVLALGLLREIPDTGIDFDRLYAPDLGDRRTYLAEQWQLLHTALHADQVPSAPSVRSLRGTQERLAFTELAALVANESIYDTGPVHPGHALPAPEKVAPSQVPGVVTVFGDAVIDHIYRIDRIPEVGTSTPGNFAEHPGGKGLNRAVAAARLGLRVQLITAIGDDKAGMQILDYLRSENVDTELVKVVAGAPTPVTAVLMTSTGAASHIGCRDYRIRLSAQDLRSPAIRAAIEQSDAVLLTFEHPRPVIEQVLATVRRMARRPLLVVHPSPAVDLPQYLYRHLDVVDYLAGTSADLAAMVPEANSTSVADTAQRLRTLGVRSVCAVEDFRCTVWSDRVNAEIPPFPAALEDSPGAQAAFAAALVYRLVSTRRPADGQDYAWATAATAATQSFGDVPDAMPFVSEIDRIYHLASKEKR